jgi:hypothetical protein
MSISIRTCSNFSIKKKKKLTDSDLVISLVIIELMSCFKSLSVVVIEFDASFRDADDFSKLVFINIVGILITNFVNIY